MIRNRRLRIKAMKRGTYNVRIRNNETREVRNCVVDRQWEDHSEYMWLEGSFSCDCNLELFYQHAGGVEFAEENLVCGNTRFTALCIELPDGRTIQLENK